MDATIPLPHQIEAIENLWIPLPDGVRLAARAWMPVDAVRHPVPVILECVPYRKRDGTRAYDETLLPYFVGSSSPPASTSSRTAVGSMAPTTA